MSKKFNINIQYENIHEDVQCDTVTEVCDFLGISKTQYIGLRSGRTKYCREYNKHLTNVKITKNKPIPKEKKKRTVINIHDIINKVKQMPIESPVPVNQE